MDHIPIVGEVYTCANCGFSVVVRDKCETEHGLLGVLLKCCDIPMTLTGPDDDN